MPNLTARLARQLPTTAWASGLAGLGAVVVGVCVPHMALTDLQELFRATRQMAAGHLSGLYPPHQVSTSAPGYPLVAALPYALAHLLWKPVVAYQRSSLLAVPALIASALYAGRKLGVPTRSGAELILAATSAVSVPVLNGLAVTFHPQDLVALAWTLLALGALVDRRWSRAGVLLALALLTRQWVGLAVLPALAWAPPGKPRRSLFLTTTAAFGALLAPFALLDYSGLRAALLGGPFGPSRVDFWALMPAGARFGPALARTGPVILAAAVSWALARRWGDGERSTVELVWAVAGCLTGRLLFDTYNAYYLAPGLVTLTVADASEPTRRGTAAAGFALVFSVLIEIPILSRFGELTVSVAYLCAFLTMLTYALRRAVETAPLAPGTPLARSGRITFGGPTQLSADSILVQARRSARSMVSAS